MAARPGRRGFVLGALALSSGGSAWWWLRAESAPGPVTTDRYGDQYQTVAKDQLPDFVRSGGPKVEEAYRFALAQPAALESVPCFCGCGKIGHRSNLDCYVKAVHAEGQVTYTSHGANCELCLGITRDVMRLRAEGRSPSEIRALVDRAFGGYGPPTPTPLPRS